MPSYTLRACSSHLLQLDCNQQSGTPAGPGDTQGSAGGCCQQPSVNCCAAVCRHQCPERRGQGSGKTKKTKRKAKQREKKKKKRRKAKKEKETSTEKNCKREKQRTEQNKTEQNERKEQNKTKQHKRTGKRKEQNRREQKGRACNDWVCNAKLTAMQPAV